MKNTVYVPVTATPFHRDETYREVLPGNAELAKYVRCFWGSERPYQEQEGGMGTGNSIVIPDTCADIIYEIDHTANTVTGMFCGINDRPFSTGRGRRKGHMVSTFAVRFYGWGAYAFSEDSLKGTMNGFFEVSSRFGWLDGILRQQLFERTSLGERAEAAEALFLGRMPRVRLNGVVNNAIRGITLLSGTLSAGELARECFVSERQLERLFHEYIGITPKKLGNLVRYQMLWNEILRKGGFHMMDAVSRYGYTDQSHLMREFKRYHSMDIHAARRYAYDFHGQ